MIEHLNTCRFALGVLVEDLAVLELADITHRDHVTSFCLGSCAGLMVDQLQTAGKCFRLGLGLLLLLLSLLLVLLALFVFRLFRRGNRYGLAILSLELFLLLLLRLRELALLLRGLRCI